MEDIPITYLYKILHECCRVKSTAAKVVFSQTSIQIRFLSRMLWNTHEFTFNSQKFQGDLIQESGFDKKLNIYNIAFLLASHFLFKLTHAYIINAAN